MKPIYALSLFTLSLYTRAQVHSYLANKTERLNVLFFYFIFIFILNENNELFEISKKSLIDDWYLLENIQDKENR